MTRAAHFYRRAFQWDIQGVPGSGGGFHSAQTTPVDDQRNPLHPGAINGGLFQRGTHGIEETFLEIHVASIDECIVRVLDAGGVVVRSKRPLLDIAYFAIVKDTEGNYLGLWEDVIDPAAVMKES